MSPLATPAPRDDAALARSILACPASAQLAVEDAEHLDLTRVVLCDVDGVATFGCPADSPLAEAAAAGRGAVLTTTSGLPGHPGTLTVLGRLETVRVEHCPCPCSEGERHVVRLVARHVSLQAAQGPRRLVRADRFTDPALALNPGYLARTADHANHHHAELLRETVAAATGVGSGSVLSAEVTGLTAAGVEISWVDADGAHRRGLAFPRTAVGTDDLAILLRDLLHAAAR